MMFLVGNMEDSVNFLYKEYGTNGITGREYFLPYLYGLKNYDFSSLICFCVKNYPRSFNEALLLSLPELWENTSKIDWFQIVKNNSPRRDIHIDLDDGEFSDVFFLMKFLKVDVFSWYMRQEDIAERDKECLRNFYNRERNSLLLDKYDLEDLDGSFYLSISDLEECQRNLAGN